MATKLGADLKKALMDAGFHDMNEVRVTPVDALKRKIGADRANEVIEYFGENDGVMEWDHAAVVLDADAKQSVIPAVYVEETNPDQTDS
jgi:hypothetical protein